jgi:hypothetical protein
MKLHTVAKNSLILRASSEIFKMMRLENDWLQETISAMTTARQQHAQRMLHILTRVGSPVKPQVSLAGSNRISGRRDEL